MLDVFATTKRRPAFPPLTTFWRFIRAIGAVDVVVAHKVLGDALPVLAHELVLRVAGAVGVHCKQKKEQTGVGQPHALCFCDFSNSVNLLQPALTLSSAPSGQSLSPSHFQRCGTHMYEPGHWKASGLQVLDSEAALQESYKTEAGQNGKFSEKSASEGPSCSSLTALLVLVGAVATVVSTVAHPVGGDAVVVGALKLAGCAEFVCIGWHTGTIQGMIFFFLIFKGNIRMQELRVGGGLAGML